MQHKLTVQQIDCLQKTMECRGIQYQYRVQTYELQLEHLTVRPQCQLYILDQHRQLKTSEIIDTIHPYFALRYKKLMDTAYDGVLRIERGWNIDERNRRFYFVAQPTQMEEALLAGYEADDMMAHFMRHIMSYLDLVEAVERKEAQWLLFLDKGIYRQLDHIHLFEEPFENCRGMQLTYGEVLPIVTDDREIDLQKCVQNMITFYYEPGQRSEIARQLLQQSNYQEFHYRIITYVRNRCIHHPTYLQDTPVAEVHGKELLKRDERFGNDRVFLISDIQIIEDTADEAVKKRMIQEVVSIVFECLLPNVIVINNVLAEKYFTAQQLKALYFEQRLDDYQYVIHKSQYKGVALRVI